MKEVNIGISVSSTEIHCYVIEDVKDHAEYFTQSMMSRDPRSAVRSLVEDLSYYKFDTKNVVIMYNGDSLNIVNYLHYSLWCMDESAEVNFDICYKTEVNEVLTKLGLDQLPTYHDAYEIPSWEFYGSAAKRMFPNELIVDNVYKNQSLCCAVVAMNGDLS